MKVALPWVLLLSAALAFADSTIAFTNGASAGCSVTGNGTTYYCTAMQTFAPDGTYTGYLGVFFTVSPDGTFTGGHVYKNDVGGNVVFTANNFSGRKVGSSFSGTFSGIQPSWATFSGSLDSETMGTERGHCYKGTCGTVTYIVSGSGWYVLN